jgi:hypothetical protein
LLSLHYYPIPYNMLAISGYILAGITIYGSHTWLITNFQLPPLIIGTVGIAIFMLLAFFTIHNKNYVTR